MEPFIGEIRPFAGSFAPAGWALCDGRLLPIGSNQALFAILGTAYGGDGVTNFALPDLRGSAPLMAGQGAGLSPRALGERGGAPTVTLGAKELPAHAHVPLGDNDAGDADDPSGAVWSQSGISRGAKLYASQAAKRLPMSEAAIGATGGDRPHTNMPPYLTLNFIIALTGIFPARA